MSDEKELLKKSFFTERQYEVLKLRAKGLTQEKIAKILNTTRENVTILEKKAKEKIEKARNTLQLFEILDPVEVKIDAYTDVFEIPRIIFREADKHNIKVLYNTTSIIGIVRRKAGDKIAGNYVRKPFTVKILRSGKIII